MKNLIRTVMFFALFAVIVTACHAPQESKGVSKGDTSNTAAGVQNGGMGKGDSDAVKRQKMSDGTHPDSTKQDSVHP